MARISVIGAGAFGLAISVHLAGIGHEVLVWSHNEEKITALRETGRSDAFPGTDIPKEIKYTSDRGKASEDRDLIVFAVASPYSRNTAAGFAPYIKEGQLITTVTKGVEDTSFATQADILKQEIPQAVVTALSGPTHAEEIVKSQPTTMVAASEDERAAEYVQDIFMSDRLRVYTSQDVLGVELGGSLKNVIALAAGMADGLGYGDNAKAALITRGIHEMAGLAVKMGAKAETLYGLTGIGDLIVTCESKHSRNRKCGMLIGQGISMDEAVKTVGQVVEGIHSAKAAMGLSEKYGFPLPITEQVNAVLYSGKDPRQGVLDLMMRDKKSEY